ncbi:MAG: hypothetical protein RIS64_248 [Bacteroidota bacterium]
MKLNKPIIGVALLALASQACKKDIEQFLVERTEIIDPLAEKKWNALAPALNDTTIAINQVFKNLVATPESKTVNLASGGLYTFSNGCTVRLAPNACVSGNGQVASGAAQLEVVLIKSRGDMVQYRMETVSDGKLLESGGQLFVRVSQNNQELSLANNQAITINYTIPSTPNGQMQIFNGTERTDGRVNWVLNQDSTANNVFVRRDSFSNNYLYGLTCNRLRWINCDYFRGDTSNLVKYYVQMADSFTNVNTGVFTVFRNLNAMIGLQGDSTTRKFGVPNGYRGVPTGSAVTFVSISRLGRDSTNYRYYLGTSDITITGNVTYALNPVRKTLAEIRTFLNSL